MAVMTMHPALAVPELLDQILHVDRPTLKRCALVSRTWRDTVRPALFARVVIATDAHLHELLAAAAARAALCARVRTLTVGPGTALSAGALARAALGLHAFAALSGLRELVWVGVDWAPLAGAPGLRAAFARVEVLRLERALQSSGALLDFVGAFPALRELRLGALLTIDVRFSGPRLDMGAPGRRARLEAFELKGHAQLHPQFWRGLLDTFDFTGLHELKTDCYMPAAIQGLTKIAERAAESLRTLTLVADFNHPVEYERREHGSLVSAATNLNLLRVSAHIDIAGALSWLAYALLSVRSDALELVEITLSHATTCRLGPDWSEDWDDIRSAILNLPRTLDGRNTRVEVTLVREEARACVELALADLVRDQLVKLLA